MTQILLNQSLLPNQSILSNQSLKLNHEPAHELDNQLDLENAWDLFDLIKGQNSKTPDLNVNYQNELDYKNILDDSICLSCHLSELFSVDGQLVCQNCGLVNENVIDETAEWRYYGADDSKGVNPARCGMPTSEFYTEASLGSNIAINGGSSYQMFKAAYYHNCNIMNYKERNFHEYITLMNNYASQADIPGCVIKEAENIYKKIIDYRTSIGLHEFRHPTREAVLASCILQASKMNDCPRSPAEMADIFHLQKSVFVTGNKEFQKYWDVVQKEHSMGIDEKLKISTPSDYINRFCSRLHLGNDFKSVCHQICQNIKEKNLGSKYVAVSIVAGVIYLVNNLFNLGMKKKQISKICNNVSEATIHKCYTDLNCYLEEILPKYVLDEALKQI